MELSAITGVCMLSHVASVTEEVNFYFCLTLINLNLNSHMKLVDRTTLYHPATKFSMLLITYTTKHAHQHFKTFSNKKTTNSS